MSSALFHGQQEYCVPIRRIIVGGFKSSLTVVIHCSAERRRAYNVVTAVAECHRESMSPTTASQQPCARRRALCASLIDSSLDVGSLRATNSRLEREACRDVVHASAVEWAPQEVATSVSWIV